MYGHFAGLDADSFTRNQDPGLSVLTMLSLELLTTSPSLHLDLPF